MLPLPPGFLRRHRLPGALLAFLLGALVLHGQPAPVLKVLFLGDTGPHRPAERLRELAPALMNRGIQLVYTEDIGALSLPTLKRYHALLVYANLDTLPPEQETALKDYIAQGGGLVALHCASASFRNSPAYLALVGAQFKSHGTGVFRPRIVAPDHPVMRGYEGFESWDETYVHVRHNEQNRTVLEQRDNEPWTWVRTEGRGRLFYTAWGHDARTWTNPGFHDLVERGVRFAAGQALPAALAHRPKIPPFSYLEQPGIPYYPPGQRSSGDAPWPRMQQPLSPEDSLQRLIVPAGFEVQLVASEPAITRPVALNWDERGRLWIIETLDYPNTVVPRGSPGRDRIVMCEDTNRDGRMDKFTVFADGLNIPTSLTFARGGVIVHQAPDTLFLKDTDGDGKADVREVLFTGWGPRDTHAGPSNLQPGLDNWVYGMVGYGGFNGTVGGESLKFGAGFYRFKNDGSRLEFLRATNNNTWGIGITEDGLLFGSTANNGPSVFMPIPNRFYAPAGLPTSTLGSIASTARFLPVTDRVRQVDVHWGYTAAAGHAFYTARAFPKDYWNRVAFVTCPTGKLVGQFVPAAQGAEFRSTHATNLISSDDEWFAPIMAEVGPDGAVWIIDWYNYIVQHNPTPAGFKNGPGNAYETPLRDQRHGRIYRIVWTGETSATPAKRLASAPAFSLANATPAQLVATLANDNLFWRRHAQRLLVERGAKDIGAGLLRLLRNPEVDAIGLNVGAVHALWTLHGLNLIEPYPVALEAVLAATTHASAGVRRNAVAVLPRTASAMTALVNKGALLDKDPQVRLAVLLALAETPEFPAARPALNALAAAPDFKPDRWMADALKMATATQSRSLEPAVVAEAVSAVHPAAGIALTRPPAAAAAHAHAHGQGPAAAAPAPGSSHAAAPAAPARSGENVVTLTLGVVPDEMRYDTTTLTIKAGQKARLVFTNQDHMPHNVVFVRPAKTEVVGALADAMLTDPQALALAYVPKSPDVLFASSLVDPGESLVIPFTAPSEPGRYPFLCTFPGHWRMMQGVLIVTAP